MILNQLLLPFPQMGQAQQRGSLGALIQQISLFSGLASGSPAQQKTKMTTSFCLSKFQKKKKINVWEPALQRGHFETFPALHATLAGGHTSGAVLKQAVSMYFEDHLCTTGKGEIIL